jgi:hypothetical protein
MRLRNGLLVCSLLLNLALGTWLIWAARTQPRRPGSIRQSGAQSPQSNRFARVSRAGSAPEPGFTKAAPPFRWSDLESTTYLDYIARLRAIGCPEPMIQDLIAADITQLYAERARAIWSPHKQEYWQKDRSTDHPNPDQLQQLMQLDKERQELQKALLGSGVRRQELIDLAYLQLHGPEQHLSWLPDDRRAAAMTALEKAGYMSEEERQRATSNGDISMEQQQALEKTLFQALEGTLSPDELKELRMRQSPEAGLLRSELRYLDVSKEEFDAMRKALARGIVR